MYSYITKHILSSVHPTTWLHTEVFYLLSALCRYIRGIVDGGEHDIILEATFEQELLNWRADQCDPLWEKTTDAFCRHGLILLYRLCGRSSRLASSLIPSGMDGDAWRIQGSLDTNTVIRRHAINVLYSLLSIPISSPQSAVQSIPFLTAGGELVQSDLSLRDDVQSRFFALYSTSRISGNLAARRLLIDLWGRKDQGDDTTWLELMLKKSWRLRVGW